MKRTLALLLAGVLGLPVLSGCAFREQAAVCGGFPDLPPTEPWAQLVSQAFFPASSSQVEAALADFGLELLKQTRTDNGEKAMGSDIDHAPFSTLVSPFSVAMALSMAANGAEGNTLAQFEDILGGGADMDEINAAWAQLTGDYCALGGSTQCSIANSLWTDNNGGVSQEFAVKCQGGYGAQVYKANLSAPRIVDDVNGWVSDRTGHMIPQIINEPFSEDTILLLVNALYLKNQWSLEFDPLNTREMEFHHTAGSDSRADYLQHFNTRLSYMQGEGAQGVALPYDDGRLAFVVILPDLYPDSPDFGEWLNHLEGSGLTELIQNRKDTLFLRFSMPRFEAEWKGELSRILSGMGLDSAFIPGAANFSGMGSSAQGCCIDQVIHAAKIEVNEKGTEAAAATVAAFNGSGMPPQEGITLILNRPFLYGIVDLQTGVPLFLGAYE